MGRLSDFARSLRPGNDQELAKSYKDEESASDRAARQRREAHRARVQRDGDGAGMKLPKRFR